MQAGGDGPIQRGMPEDRFPASGACAGELRKRDFFLVARVELGLLLGLLGYGKAPKASIPFPALIRKEPPNYGKLPENGGSRARL